MAEQAEGTSESPTYSVSGDRQSFGQIQMFMTYAALALERGDFDNAMLNVEFVWQRLPNDIKSRYERPSEILKERLDRIPTVEQLYEDAAFQTQYGGKYKSEERYRDAVASQQKMNVTNECLDKFNRALDEAGLSWRQSGGGLAEFGNYDDATKGLKFE